jgi:hypothetical protein
LQHINNSKVSPLRREISKKVMMANLHKNDGAHSVGHSSQTFADGSHVLPAGQPVPTAVKRR